MTVLPILAASADSTFRFVTAKTKIRQKERPFQALLWLLHSIFSFVNRVAAATHQ